MTFRRVSLVLFCLILSFVCFTQIDSKPITSQETCIKNNTCNATSLNYLFKKFIPSPTSKELCTFCDAIVPILRYFIDKNDTSYFPQLVELFCDVFKIEDKTVCDYIVKTYQVKIFRGNLD